MIGKLLVRISVIVIAIYFMLANIVAQTLCVDILNDSYILLFELIVVVYSFSEGRYHCKYLKFTMLGIFFSELITRLDNYFNFLSVSEHNAFGIVLIAIGIGVSMFKALMHFYKVGKLRQKRKRLYDGNDY